MLSVKNRLISIHKKQRTVDDMIKHGILAKDEEHFENEGKTIDVDILYQKDATVGLGTCSSKGIMPEHSHDTRHYLICLTGRFIVKFDGVVRILSMGDCVSIPKNVPHTTQCVAEGKLVFVNVPADDSWGSYG